MSDDLFAQSVTYALAPLLARNARAIDLVAAYTPQPFGVAMSSRRWSLISCKCFCIFWVWWRELRSATEWATS